MTIVFEKPKTENPFEKPKKKSPFKKRNIINKTYDCFT